MGFESPKQNPLNEALAKLEQNVSSDTRERIDVQVDNYDVHITKETEYMFYVYIGDKTFEVTKNEHGTIDKIVALSAAADISPRNFVEKEIIKKAFEKLQTTLQ